MSLSPAALRRHPRVDDVPEGTSAGGSASEDAYLPELHLFVAPLAMERGFLDTPVEAGAQPFGYAALTRFSLNPLKAA